MNILNKLNSLKIMSDYKENLSIYEKLNQEKISILILLFAFSLPLSHAAISFFTIVFLLIYMFSGQYKEKYLHIKSSKTLISLFVFMIYTSFSLLWTTDMKEGLDNIRLFSYWLLIPVLAFYIKKKDINKIISGFLLGMFISEIIAYGMYFELWTMHGHGPEYPSPFMNHILYSIFLAFTATILLYRILSKKFSLSEKIFFLLFFLSVTGNLFVSIGRTGQVAFIFSIITIFILHYKLSFKSLITAVTLISVIFFTSYKLSPNFQERVHDANHDISLIREGDLTSSLGTRIAYWIISYEMIKKDPILGVGVGDIDFEKRSIVDDVAKIYKIDINFCKTFHLHNQFLNSLVSGGVIGFVLFIIFLYNIFKLPIKDKEIKNISTLFLIVFLISFMTEVVFLRQFSLILFVFFIGIFTASSEKQ